VVKDKENNIYIMDTKWKLLNSNSYANYGISQSDMYQMYAYQQKYRLHNSSKMVKGVTLIYPKMNEEIKVPSFEADDVNVQIQFVDMLKEFNSLKVNESALPKGYEDILKSDTYIGIQKTLEELDFDSDKECNNKFFIRVILNKIDTVFKVVLKNKDMFKGVPSASVQVMMISLTNSIIYGFVGDKFDITKKNEIISLMAKCAIDSDATVGFNLPLIDPKKPDNGNFFVSIMNQFKNENISSKEIDDTVKLFIDNGEIDKLKEEWDEGKEKDTENDAFGKKISSDIMKNFKQNISTLFDLIIDEAKRLKEKAEKDREAEAAKIK
jgi:hypothetical protein